MSGVQKVSSSWQKSPFVRKTYNYVCAPKNRASKCMKRKRVELQEADGSVTLVRGCSPMIWRSGGTCRAPPRLSYREGLKINQSALLREGRRSSVEGCGRRAQEMQDTPSLRSPSLKVLGFWKSPRAGRPGRGCHSGRQPCCPPVRSSCPMTCGSQRWKHSFFCNVLEV